MPPNRFHDHFTYRKQLRRRSPTAVALLITLSLLVVQVHETMSLAQSAALNSNAGEKSFRLAEFRKQSKISPGDQADLVASLSVTQSVGPANREGGATKMGTSYAVLNVEFESSDACVKFSVPGAKIFSRIDRFADVFVEADQNSLNVLNAIAALSTVREINVSGIIQSPPPPRVETGETVERRGLFSSVRSEKIVHGGIESLTGKGVTIAIIDSGIDFRHPDFISYDSAGEPTSRIAFLWDTTSDVFDSAHLGSRPPLDYPNGQPIGTLYTREQLTAELRAKTRKIPITDETGHGTACAGIAAGNGKGSAAHLKDLIGVAPDANIIAVRIGGSRLPDGSVNGSLRNGKLFNSICDWLDTVVGSKPLVISCSWGSQLGGQDSSRVFERELNQRFALNRSGRVVVFAAGNAAQHPWHMDVRFAGNESPGRLNWQAEEGGRLELFFNGDDADDALISTTGQTKLHIVAVRQNPYSKQSVAHIGLQPGEGTLYLSTVSGKSSKIDAFITYGYFRGSRYGLGKMIGSPGLAENVIAVGSYDWNDQFDGSTYKDFCETRSTLMIGGLSCYSSPGFVRDTVIKPDITAPGQFFAASCAHLLDGSGVNKFANVDETGNYMLFNGTSAATPYVAGVIALMMQKKPSITSGEIRLLLQKGASRGEATGDLPNERWGNGKLDLMAIGTILKSMK
jgi:subtilisin family serine protease